MWTFKLNSRHCRACELMLNLKDNSLNLLVLPSRPALVRLFILPISPSPILTKCMSNLSFDKPQNFTLNIHCRLVWFSIENSKRWMGKGMPRFRTESHYTHIRMTQKVEVYCCFGRYLYLSFHLSELYMLLLVNSGKMFRSRVTPWPVVCVRRCVYWMKTW